MRCWTAREGNSLASWHPSASILSQLWAAGGSGRAWPRRPRQRPCTTASLKGTGWQCLPTEWAHSGSGLALPACGASASTWSEGPWWFDPPAQGPKQHCVRPRDLLPCQKALHGLAPAFASLISCRTPLASSAGLGGLPVVLKHKDLSLPQGLCTCSSLTLTPPCSPAPA